LEDTIIPNDTGNYVRPDLTMFFKKTCWYSITLEIDGNIYDI